MDRIYKTLVLLIIFFLLKDLNAVTAQIAVEWKRCLGGTSNDAAWDVHVTPDGDYLLGGYTISNNGNVSGNHGNADYWVVKIGRFGDLKWQKTYGGTANDFGRCLAVTSDGGFIIAGNSESVNGDVTGNHGGYDCWVVRADPNGNIIWQKSFGGSNNEYANSIQLTSDGGFIIAGQTASNNGDVSGNWGGIDYWVVKLDPTGTIEWQKCLGGSGTDVAMCVQQTTDGGFVVLGTSGSSSGQVTGNLGGDDYWLVKLNSAGTLMWQKSYGGWDYEEAFFIQQTSDGGFIISGNTYTPNLPGHHGQTDIYIVKTDTAGVIQWQQLLGGTQLDFGYQIHQTMDGGFIVSGGSYSNNGNSTINRGYTDYWILKLDFYGNLLWQKSMGGGDYDDAYAVKQTSDGGYIVTGSSKSFNFDVTGNHGNYDIWVLKLTEDFSTITGKIFIDLNSNNIPDMGEPPIIQYAVSEVNTGVYSFSGFDGVYYVFVHDTGSFVVTPFTNINYYTASPSTHSAHFTGLNQTDSLNHFAYQPTGVFNDLCVTLSPVTPFRPGFNANYVIDYTNQGTTTLSPVVKFYPDNGITFVSASPSPDNITSDSLTWNLSQLSPYQSGSINLTVHVDNSLSINSIVNSHAVVEPLAGDINPSCNASYWEVIITGSLDPNDILVNRNLIFDYELSNPPNLEYIIRFQNTGNDTAFVVRILNLIDTVKLDLASFQFMASSHPVSIKNLNQNGELQFSFNNILLPDHIVNEPESHGFVRYKIKPRSNLILNDSILNNAAIYFDFNAPVITNTALTEIGTPTDIHEVLNSDAGFFVNPNPTFDRISITIQELYDHEVVVDLYDIYGLYKSNIFNGLIPEKRFQINKDISGLSKGIYFVQLRSGSGTKAVKLIKL